MLIILLLAIALGGKHIIKQAPYFWAFLYFVTPVPRLEIYDKITHVRVSEHCGQIFRLKVPPVFSMFQQPRLR